MASDPMRQMTIREHLRPAGIKPYMADVAEKLDISHSYADQLLRGSKPISAPLQSKLDALIAAKANGPQYVEQVELDLDLNPVKASKSRFIIDHDHETDTCHIVEVIAEVRGYEQAKRICDLLNKEGG